MAGSYSTDPSHADNSRPAEPPASSREALGRALLMHEDEMFGGETHPSNWEWATGAQADALLETLAQLGWRLAPRPPQARGGDTVAERAAEIGEGLDAMKELAGRLVCLIADLHKDCTRTGRSWSALAAEHFSAWPTAWGSLSKFAAQGLGPWGATWHAYSALEPAKRAQFDVRWREAHKPQVVSDGAVVRPAQWQPRSA
jgi:hypothetical protein